MSLVNGGSGFPYFAPAMYSYLSGQDVCSIVATVEEVPNAELKAALTKVWTCTCTCMCVVLARKTTFTRGMILVV